VAGAQVNILNRGTHRAVKHKDALAQFLKEAAVSDNLAGSVGHGCA
jgi:hypothetical protein